MYAIYSSSGRVQRVASAGFARTSRLQSFRRSAVRSQLRWRSNKKCTTLAVPSQPRFSAIGVQHLSDHVFNQVFPKGCKPPPEELVNLSKEHLRRHDLLGKTNDNSEPIAFDLPPLQGSTLDEHFYRLGKDCAEPFLTLAKEFVNAEIPEKPTSWVRRSGWTKYYPDGRTEAVDVPDDAMLCFDIETLYKESPFAVMACAASPTAWFAWLSPWLLGESKSDRHLIPLGDPAQARIIVGHNVSFDRARVFEEYNLKQSRNAFLDTMSFHVAVNGMCSRQRPTWMKHKKNRELRERVAAETPDHDLAELLGGDANEEQELWVERSSINSLRDVAKFHLDMSMDKTARDDFGTLDREGILAKLDELLEYCATDVAITHKIYQVVFPNFLTVCPHPVSFAALRHLTSVILPVDRSWDEYISNAEAKYRELSDAVQERLVGLTEKALALKDDATQWENDPWLKQLDWSGQEIRMTKPKRKGDSPKPAAKQKKPGMPQWYKDLFAKNDAPINITVRTRIAPLLLKMSWDGNPLFWSDKYGWTFRVSKDQSATYEAKQMIVCEFDEEDPVLKDDNEHAYIKLPHKDGPAARCANVLAKGYLAFFENGILSSAYSYAKEALEMNASCSYWISARDRITGQMVIYENDLLPSQGKKNGKKVRKKSKSKEDGFILPHIIPMGTITRRAVENTWLTASNAKKNRVGSELKAMIKAPKGYCFVGADVDSQELWIASLVGDATFKLHGGNAVGFMTLEGTKAAGTDLHSRTAAILGISRNNAKVFNYGRIYGAGLKFAATLLRQFNPALSEKETSDTSSKLYKNTKGTKTNKKALYQRPFWRGGTESLVFNKLEEFAEEERPRTPVLGAGITEALMARYISKGGYLTSRINWAIQSSGVDYLHLLIVSMNYLITRYGIDARLAITVHDEIRYLVKTKDKYRAAMALQVANVWTRAMFAQQAGIDDLPQSCAYFSAVDIDHVLRKEVDMECVTPSHPTPIAPGESLDIKTLLDKGNEALLDPAALTEADDVKSIEYVPRVAVMEAMRQASGDSLAFIKAQVANDSELRDIIRRVKPSAPPKDYAKYNKKPLQQQFYPRLVPMQAKETLPVTEAMESTYRYGNGGLHQWAWSNNAAKRSRPAV